MGSSFPRFSSPSRRERTCCKEEASSFRGSFSPATSPVREAFSAEPRQTRRETKSGRWGVVSLHACRARHTWQRPLPFVPSLLARLKSSHFFPRLPTLTNCRRARLQTRRRRSESRRFREKKESRRQAGPVLPGSLQLQKKALLPRRYESLRPQKFQRLSRRPQQPEPLLLLEFAFCCEQLASSAPRRTAAPSGDSARTKEKKTKTHKVRLKGVATPHSLEEGRRERRRTKEKTSFKLRDRGAWKARLFCRSSAAQELCYETASA